MFEISHQYHGSRSLNFAVYLYISLRGTMLFHDDSESIIRYSNFIPSLISPWSRRIHYTYKCIVYKMSDIWYSKKHSTKELSNTTLVIITQFSALFQKMCHNIKLPLNKISDFLYFSTTFFSK